MMTPILPKLDIEQILKVFLAFIATALIAYLSIPKLIYLENPPDLNETIPSRFGDWEELVVPYAQVSLSTGNETDLNQPYDQTVMRAYKNKKGQIVHLAVAWGRAQRQEVKIHRPDLCYVAQGYRVKSLFPVTFAEINAPEGTVSGKRMLAEGQRNKEAVSYWIRIGGLFSESAWDTRFYIFREGLKGNVPDGVLVRASINVSDNENIEFAWPILEDFLRELVSSVPASTKRLLLG